MARNSQFTIILPWMRTVIPDNLPALLVYARIFALTQGPDEERPVTEAELGQWAKIAKHDNIAQALDYLLGYRKGENGERVRTGRCLIAHTENNEPCYTRGDRNKAYRWYPVDIPEMDIVTDWRLEIRIDGWMLHLSRVDTAAKLLAYAVIYKFCTRGRRNRCDCSQIKLAEIVGVSERQIRRILSSLCPAPETMGKDDPSAVITVTVIPHGRRAYGIVQAQVAAAQAATKTSRNQPAPAPTGPAPDKLDADRAALDADNAASMRAARRAAGIAYATARAAIKDRENQYADAHRRGNPASQTQPAPQPTPQPIMVDYEFYDEL